MESVSSPTQSTHREIASTSSPIRVLFVDHTAALGGGEIALLNLIRVLDHSRFTPVVALFSDGALRQMLIDAGAEVHLLPLSPEVVNKRKDSLSGSSLLKFRVVLKAALFVLRLAKFMRAQKIDLVHTNSLKADLIGGAAARLARKPVVWHVRDRISDDYLPARVVKAFRFLARVLPTCVVVNSAATGFTLVPGAESLPRRVRVVHDGTMLQDNPPHKRESAAAIIGLVGRITPWKGQHIFIEAAASVIKQFPEARFQIIGSALFEETEYDAKIRQMVIDLGLSSHVEFTGFRSDVIACIASLDLLVHASVSGEPFGQVVIEAMSSAVPLVATRGGGVPEIVVDGVTGILVPMGDSPAMAAAICELLKDPHRAFEMGLAGREHVRNHFTIQHTASNLQRVFEQVLARNDV